MAGWYKGMGRADQILRMVSLENKYLKSSAKK